MNGQCSKCRNQLAEDAKFCTRCGAMVLQYEVPEEARQGTEPEGRRTSESPSESRGLLEDTYGFLTDPSSRRFLRVDPSGGVLTVVAPILIWSAAVGVGSWILIGLIALRFDLGFVDLEDLLYSQLIIVGIILSVTANAYVIHSYRNRSGALWHVLSYLAGLWAVFLSVGLAIMIVQVWTDFAGGPDELRRMMFSLIGVGTCGTYTGFLSLAVFGPDRIYYVVRWVVYVLTAIIAAEILEALWLTGRNMTGAEIGGHFVTAGRAAFVSCVVYSIIAVVMGQVRARQQRIGVLVAYLALGLTGFTIGVWALWDSFPEAGPVRFVFGGVVVVSIATIGLLLVQHFHRTGTTGTRPADGQDPQSQTSPP